MVEHETLIGAVTVTLVDGSSPPAAGSMDYEVASYGLNIWSQGRTFRTVIPWHRVESITVAPH